MDEKLENRLRELRACKFVTNSTMLQIGQAFKDAGWTEPQQPAEGEHSLLETARKVQVCMHNLESQKELISVVDTYDDSTKNTLTSKFTPKDWIAVGAKAQLAHDKATMVKLPSENELALWLCDHLSYTSRGLAQVLRECLEAIWSQGKACKLCPVTCYRQGMSTLEATADNKRLVAQKRQAGTIPMRKGEKE